MPDRLVLHIGMHKTGTTSIQSALHGYDDGTIRMARLGVANHSIPMLTCYAADPTRYHVWVRQGLSPDEVLRRRGLWRIRLGEELALPRGTLVISGEEISLMRPASVANMLADLRPLAGQTDILGWMRPAASYIGSALQQQIRAGQKTLDLPLPRYRDRFAPYLDIMGRDRLDIRLYDDVGQNALSAVVGFCAAVGIPAQSVDDRTENAAMSLDALRLVYRLNRDGPPTIGTPARLRARSRLLHHVTGRFKGRFQLPPEMALGAVDPADIAWAEALTGFPLHDGTTGDPARASTLLNDWINDIPDSVCDTLDEDLAILRIRLSPKSGISEKVAALYTALLDEAEAQMALAPVFAAGRRGPSRAQPPAHPDES